MSDRAFFIRFYDALSIIRFKLGCCIYNKLYIIFNLGKQIITIGLSLNKLYCMPSDNSSFL